MKHQIEKIILANGATLINVRVENLPISIVSAWFRAGSRFDPAGKEGLAHLLEHLLVKRTKKYSDEIERLKAIESHGIKCNAFTSYETSHQYYIQEKSETFKALEFLTDGLCWYVFDEQDLEKEKDIVLNEMRENKLNPREYIWNLSNQALWKNSSMGRSFFGDDESINSISESDLKLFIQSHYSQSSCTFVTVGDESIENIGKYLNEKMNNGGVNIIEDSETFVEPKKIAIEKTDANQVTVAVAFRATAICDEQKDIAAIDFIRDYLANKWISKLIEELRLKRDFTYWVDGESENFSQTGVLRFIFSCDKKNVTKTIEIIFEEIKKIKSNMFNEISLDIYKRSFVSSLAIKFVDPYEYLWWYGWQATVSGKEKLLDIDEYSKIIANLKNEDIQRVASKYLNEDNVSISAIGNIDEKDLDFRLE